MFNAILGNDKERFLALAKLLVPDTHITAHNLQEPSEDAKATLLAKWKTYVHDKLATGNTLVPSYDFPLARAMRVFLYKQAQIEPKWAEDLIETYNVDRSENLQAIVSLMQGLKHPRAGHLHGLDIGHLMGTT